VRSDLIPGREVTVMNVLSRAFYLEGTARDGPFLARRLLVRFWDGVVLDGRDAHNP
jgi:hypothetical protein